MNFSSSGLARTFDMTGRVVLITGAGGLLGRQHAVAVAQCGAIPILTDISRTSAERARQAVEAETHVSGLALGMDVTSRASCDAALERVLDAYDRVDVLLNNAALNPKVEGKGLGKTRFENLELEFWQSDLTVGLTGAFLASQVFGSHMARRGRGVIVNIASDLSLIAPDQRIYRQAGLAEDEQPVKPVTYSVVKGGLVMLTKYLASYWAERGVRVNALSPGGVYADQPADFVERLTNLIPLGRMARLDEYRAAVAFLCSDASSYMTGANLVIDGGRTCW